MAGMSERQKRYQGLKNKFPLGHCIKVAHSAAAVSLTTKEITRYNFAQKQCMMTIKFTVHE